MNLAGSEVEARVVDTLVQGGYITTDVGTLESGQNLGRGTVIGRVTTTGELKQALKASVDGSEVPRFILVHAIDASGAATDCQFYTGGDFNSADLVWDAGYTAADKAGAFDGTPIKVVTPV